ncbi:MAG TPA: DUF5615 family PIN-like protein [Planctomycetaceae bacterium]|nr:DUF5615 family PIN-like protein [Planctomycetaceae bacterium]
MFDEDLDNDILRGVIRNATDFDVVRVQDVGLSGMNDELVLEWAASHERILVTHDVTTMISHAWSRVSRGLALPGVFVIPQSVPIGSAIADILLIESCSSSGDWIGQVRYLPLS